MREAWSGREIATMLAALRAWQRSLIMSGAPSIQEHFDDASPPLGVDDIDALCEKINFGSRI